MVMLKKKIDKKIVDNPEEYIPAGVYCYDEKLCPFWDRHSEFDPQMNGYCHLLGKGDWMENGTMLLWDQVKECGINEDYGDEDE
jgi:hypothetical protein